MTSENEKMDKMTSETEKMDNITTNNPEKKYIYMCSWFETRKHRKSHTKMYYEIAEQTNWIFDTPDWYDDLVRIEYICVMSNTKEYSMAQTTGEFYNDNPKMLDKYKKENVVEGLNKMNGWI